MQAHMRVHIGALSMSRLACSINKVHAICVHTFVASAAKAPTPESGHPVRRRVCLHSVQSRVLLRIYRRVVCMRLRVTILEKVTPATSAMLWTSTDSRGCCQIQ